MNYQDGDISLAWEEILGMSKYHLMLVDIQDNYPEKKSLTVSFDDIDGYSIDFAQFVLARPDKVLEIGRNVIKSLLPATWDPSQEINLIL